MGFLRVHNQEITRFKVTCGFRRLSDHSSVVHDGHTMNIRIRLVLVFSRLPGEFDQELHTWHEHVLFHIAISEFFDQIPIYRV